MAVNNAIGLIQTSTGNGEERGFYTPTEVSRIVRIPQWTLNHWRREGIIVPSVEWVDEQDKTHSGHSFETLVFLRLLRMLRDNRITLFRAVGAAKELKERFGPPGKNWSEARIFTQHGHVYVYGRDNGAQRN